MSDTVIGEPLHTNSTRKRAALRDPFRLLSAYRALKDQNKLFPKN